MEDENKLAAFIKKVLEREKYAMDVVFDGQEALDYVTTYPYDLILLDILLPKKNGFDVIKELRNKKIFSPVLLLTAKDAVEDKIQGLDLGADEHTVVFSKDLKIIYSSPNLNKPYLPFSLLQQIETINNSPEIHSIKIHKNNTNYRVLVKRIVLPENKEFILEIAASLREVEALQRQLIYWLLVIATLIGIPLVLWARSFASKVSRPLEEMSDKAKKITVNKLSKNIEIRSSYQEANDLADSFNDMIQRLDQSILEIKRFTSDASHELRTPLSVLKSQIQMALRDKETPLQFGEIFKNELVEVNYMEKIVDNLLTLSRYDSGKITLIKSIVDLSDLCIEQCEKMKIFAKNKNVRIVLGSIHPAKIKGDKIFLTQVIFNPLTKDRR